MRRHATPCHAMPCHVALTLALARAEIRNHDHPVADGCVFVLPCQVTWPAYFVEFVRTVEEQRRRDGAKAAAAEAEAAAADLDGMMSVSEDDEEEEDGGSSSNGDSDGSSSKRGGGRKRRRRRRGEEEEEEAETDEEERDTLETLCSAFEAGEHHLLPLEMKVQAIEYLVDRAMEVTCGCLHAFVPFWPRLGALPAVVGRVGRLCSA